MELKNTGEERFNELADFIDSLPAIEQDFVLYLTLDRWIKYCEQTLEDCQYNVDVITRLAAIKADEQMRTCKSIKDILADLIF